MSITPDCRYITIVSSNYLMEFFWRLPLFIIVISLFYLTFTMFKIMVDDVLPAHDISQQDRYLLCGSETLRHKNPESPFLFLPTAT